MLTCLCLTVSHIVQAVGPTTRTRPYRNDRIINAIRSLYFDGGANSVVTHFNDIFPSHHGPHGIVTREVPIPMVALVATAVSLFSHIQYHLANSSSSMQLYTSGVLVFSRPSSSPPMPSMMCIKATSTPLITRVLGTLTHSTL